MAFALLFDDIDPQLHGPDVDAFSSFGDAQVEVTNNVYNCLLYTSPSPRDQRGSRMPSSA